MALEQLKVMVCDDSSLVRKQLKEIIEKCGHFEIVEAKDGKEAMNIIEEHIPDIIFMDICMPNMDGMEVIENISNLNTNTYIVVVSSLGTKEYFIRAITYGAKEFIPKPFTEAQIINALEKATQKLRR